jgi:hypothetical protein
VIKDQRKLVRLAQPGAEVKDRSRTRRRKLLRVKEGRNVGWSLLQSKKEKLIEVVRGQTWSLSELPLMSLRYLKTGIGLAPWFKIDFIHFSCVA